MGGGIGPWIGYQVFKKKKKKMEINSGAKFELTRFNEIGNFGLWQMTQ